MNEEARTNNDQVVMVGAASKGIIQREFQHNAMVYKSAYSRNPFDNVTDAELDDYKQYVEKRQRGEPVDDVPEHVRHLLLEPVDRQLHGITSPVDPKSIQSPTSDEEGDSAVNGEDSKIGDVSGASRSSKEGSPIKDLSSDKSSKKDKKKKGIRTPSFLKSKKKKDKEQKGQA